MPCGKAKAGRMAATWNIGGRPNPGCRAATPPELGANPPGPPAIGSVRTAVQLVAGELGRSAHP